MDLNLDNLALAFMLLTVTLNTAMRRHFGIDSVESPGRRRHLS
jgi:hypothetical protein